MLAATVGVGRDSRKWVGEFMNNGHSNSNMSYEKKGFLKGIVNVIVPATCPKVQRINSGHSVCCWLLRVSRCLQLDMRCYAMGLSDPSQRDDANAMTESEPPPLSVCWDFVSHFSLSLKRHRH